MEVLPLTSTFDFEVILLNAFGHELKRECRQASSFTEVLDSGTALDMVQVPAGMAQLGSPETELGRSDSEQELQVVNLPSFFISKYPITQAQWKAVALLPEVDRSLELEPAYFPGISRPVEQISWYDAIEFCARLSRATERSYRLPTEVEWEYACRAGTTTPFHFGETITTDLANYCGEHHSSKRRRQGNWYSGSYGEGPTGSDRKETTAAGYFQIANGFGLYDMHGNVWEWCCLHSTAAGEESELQPLRGGSWKSSPVACRAASRWLKLAGSKEAFVGFRVVHSTADNRPNPEKLLPREISQSILSNSPVSGNVTIGNITQHIIVNSYSPDHTQSDG